MPKIDKNYIHSLLNQVKDEEGYATIDSFKLRVPLRCVEILHPDLLDAEIIQTINASTGELKSEREQKKKSMHIPIAENTDHFRVSKVVRFGMEYFEIYIKSAILCHRYMQGIDLNTISYLYENMIRTGAFKLSYEDFMYGEVTDMDIKIDVSMSKDELKESSRIMHKQTPKSKERGKGSHRYPNGNIEWNVRERGTLQRPFAKIYFKKDQMQIKDEMDINKGLVQKGFFENFGFYNIPDIARVEATIKTGAEIKKFFSLENTTLHSILSIKEESLANFVKYALCINIDINTDALKMDIPKNKRHTPQDTMVLIAIELGLKTNVPFEKLLESWLPLFESGKARYRMKEKLTELYEEVYAKMKWVMEKREAYEEVKKYVGDI